MMASSVAFTSTFPSRLFSRTRYYSTTSTGISALRNTSSHPAFLSTSKLRSSASSVIRMEQNIENEAQQQAPQLGVEGKPLVSSSESEEYKGPFGWFKRLIAQRNQLKASTLRNYGIAAIISYGMFDFVTYTISFLLSLRAYIAAGKTLTWKTLPQVLALMWGINNLSRPFRIAGAIALAPIVDRRIVKPIGAFFSRLRQPNNPNNSA